MTKMTDPKMKCFTNYLLYLEKLQIKIKCESSMFQEKEKDVFNNSCDPSNLEYV